MVLGILRFKGAPMFVGDVYRGIQPTERVSENLHGGVAEEGSCLAATVIGEGQGTRHWGRFSG